MDHVRVKASATSANLGAGFDVLGIALEDPYDIIEVRPAKELTIKVEGRGAASIPQEPEKNTAGVVALEMGKNVSIKIKSGIRPGSGLGSSAAPAAGTAVAINELFSMGYTKEELVWIAAKGEKAAAGSIHADNVAPCILGGITVVCGNYVNSIDVPEMGIVAILPDIIVSTKVAREVLPKTVPLEEMINNIGKASMLMLGAGKKDPHIIGRSLMETFNEKYRSRFIKGYSDVKDAAMELGAYGVAISGSGPTMIALSPVEKCSSIADAMRKKFTLHGVDSEAYITCTGKGVQII
ncbi:homoserine kinase [Methanocella sp. CWC-04]|uniref:Homoserine kinase n=1 Tax=Methanooceanicella nereidis TaxID=2052831 RepID=A0AAP2RED5_9EURY|nr:homoserine kinase [Methanocella sp. CWC-04]MCD1296134.1 homoserine kinase [Methanocella sp. CWC-04]